MPKPVQIALSLALVWAVAGMVMWAAHQRTPTPERIAAYVAAHPLDEIDDISERERVIRTVANQINQLSYEHRRIARERRDENPAGQAFFRSMKPAEKALFTELTIGPSFDHMMRALNEMTPEERRELASRAVADLQKDGAWPEQDAALWEAQGEELFEKVSSEGLRAFYEGANAETKLDFAPVLEEVQRSMQNPRRKWKSSTPDSSVPAY